MANLPSQHPTLSIHLSDITLTPLITSSSSPSHLDSLTSLTSSALSSQTAAQRAHLGRPQRIMVEYPDHGAVVLQTYLDPRESSAAASACACACARGKDGDTIASVDDDDADLQQSEDAAPLLVGVIVAGSSDEAREARRAAARLERVGREFQREWMAQTERGRSGAGD
ncbi:uncharacterized protein UV8b_04636 [Ustilaginoidea virens]|uniref:Uncharacterized protein n=1 Tax=Ustilaginoidea virens TaxID=1159556 RepID=A0A1B5KUU1_USTVR|nr:uncharacterized protein UV8b_04636 [Ustilaginoidea virens]QUC20395.1 hypothetical protein UV8b_04636 [Ustilaginoidea virens]GAO14678.1 hypothetical protein UVI_02029070 [Ustilaginoidea virens]